MNGGEQEVRDFELPNKKYQIIYADPPWRYGGGKGKNSKNWGNSLSAYDCMKLKDLKAITIENIADENCALFMWTTLPMLQEGLELMSAWGFKYKTTAFVWNKTYKNNAPYCGMGYWTRSGAEICLLGFRGKLERKSTRVYQVITAPVTSHSKKPDEIRKRIIELIGDLTRIELFARQRADGWDVWGLEVPKETQATLCSPPFEASSRQGVGSAQKPDKSGLGSDKGMPCSLGRPNSKDDSSQREHGEG